jgi:KDO2-lipid IV(A) lauroyltransferase
MTHRLTTRQRLRYGAEAAGFFLLMGLFRILPVDAASRLGGWLGRAIFSHLPPDRIARANLKAAFPEKSSAERDGIRIAMWDNLGRTVAEYPHLARFHIDGDDARIHVEGAGHVDAAAARGKGLLVLSGHLANWEILPITGELLGVDGASVVRPPNNPFVARWIARQRGLTGPKEQIGKHSGARRIFARLRDRKAIFMLVDQKNNEGIAVPFFGRDAMTTPVAAALALKLDATILFAGNRRRGRSARFDLTIEPAADFTPSGDEARDTRALTEMITARIEKMIRAEPSQWLWIHRRWPTES